jgi:hypothetical protein
MPRDGALTLHHGRRSAAFVERRRAFMQLLKASCEAVEMTRR